MKDGFEQLKVLYVDAKKGDVPRSLLLSGAEGYPLESYLRRIKSTVNMPELNITEFRDVFAYEAVRHAFDVPPMMSAFRLVILNRSGYFKWNRDERLMGLFAEVPDHVRLIVYEEDLNKISASYKRFAKTALSVVLDKVTANYLTQWIREEYAEGRKKYRSELPEVLSPQIVSRLAEIGQEKGMHEIKNCMDYLVSLGKEIQDSDVDHYFGSLSETSVWALYDSVLTGDLFSVLPSLLENSDPFELFGRLHSVVRNAFRRSRGEFQGTPYMMRIAAQLSSRFSAEELDRILEAFARMDVEMKSTSADKAHILQQAALLLRPNTQKRR